MLFSEARKQIGTWADLECRPTGRIDTKDQYDYLKYYSDHTAIDDKYIKSFEEVKGKYIHLGSWFGGASFYFSLEDKPEGVFETSIRAEDGRIIKYTEWYEKFSYGKLGKIEFN